ncbi:MAG: hypothetical protein ABIQ09_17155 [Jatrophihabitantaceae bacterium]
MDKDEIERARDPRYHFQGFDPDFLIGLGRLLLGSSYLEGSASILLARLIDNDDSDGLALGRRLTANAAFPWLLDHIRAVSELKLPSSHHVQIVAWVKRADAAYVRRSRIVHAGLGVDATGDEIRFIFLRHNARAKTFQSDVWPARASEIHQLAALLEAIGLEAVDLMGLIPKADRGV